MKRRSLVTSACLGFVLLFGPVASTWAQYQSLSDPTRPESWQQPAEAAISREQDYQLSSIFFSSRTKLAVINGERLREGETIGLATVQRIDRRSVTLTVSGRLTTLWLHQGTAGVIKRKE